jgi:hypothetical protein
MEVLRRTIIRAIVIVAWPFVYFLFWLTGSVNWRREFRDSLRSMWRAERARDWTIDQRTPTQRTGSG